MASPSLPRTAVTAADPDASVFAPTIIAPAQVVRIGATSDTPGSVAAVSLYFLGASLQPLSVARLKFTAQAAADWGATCVATPEYDACWPVAGVTGIILKVDSISAGSWSFDRLSA